MKLLKCIEELKDYYRRFGEGKVEKIKTKHVDRVLRKLRSKQKAVMKELEATKNVEKRQRMTRKLSTLAGQIGRGKWLRTQIEQLNKGR